MKTSGATKWSDKVEQHNIFIVERYSGVTYIIKTVKSSQKLERISVAIKLRK